MEMEPKCGWKGIIFIHTESRLPSLRAYEAEARAQGINILSSEYFIVGDLAANPFMRLSICSPDKNDATYPNFDKAHMNLPLRLFPINKCINS